MSSHHVHQRLLRIPLALAVVLALMLSLLSIVVAQPASEAKAADASRWQAGNIISDANFYDGTSLTGQQVLAFMRTKNAGCVSGARCIVDYRQATPNMAANAYCSRYAGNSSQHAATIIAQVGAACGVSPRVLLVLLEKEQSLVTSRNPTQRQFDAATGFACPDTAPCDSSFGGFFYQVYYAARQFKVYQQFPGSFNYRAGVHNTILFNPDTRCGSGRVYIENQATAGLYNYTPYQPNAAALANLYGTGDTCSAYGNRNFWRMWTDWFGSPTMSGSPFGSFDTLRAQSGGAYLSGWALDPDTADSIRVHVYANGKGVANVLANGSRPDVARIYPDYGPARGFALNLNLAAGSQRVCVYAIDAAGPGSTASLGCKTVTVSDGGTGMTGAPLGSVDRVQATGDAGVTVAGWAADPDTRAPIAVHIYVDGRLERAVRASGNRPDIGRIYPTLGSGHGFTADLTLEAGSRRVCVYAIDAVGGHGSRTLGCSTVSVLGTTGRTGAPFGKVDAVTASGPQITARGWAIDPDTRASIRVHVYVDGRAVANVAADGTRADVARNHPVYGAAHGYTATFRADPGRRNVCVYAIDQVGGHGNPRLGCQVVTVAQPSSRSPIGSIDRILNTRDDQVQVAGWAADPDTAASIPVHIYVDGRLASATRASSPRADVARAYPALGSAHGFTRMLTLDAGARRICVYGIDVVGGDPNANLGCRTVDVVGATARSGAPFGKVDQVSVSGRQVTVRGWAIDPDTRGAIQVHVYANGRGVGTTLADAPRPDVGSAYPVYGPNHGYSLTVPLAPGQQDVCAYAIDAVGGDGNPRLACQTVTVR